MGLHNKRGLIHVLALLTLLHRFGIRMRGSIWSGWRWERCRRSLEKPTRGCGLLNRPVRRSRISCRGIAIYIAVEFFWSLGKFLILPRGGRGRRAGITVHARDEFRLASTPIHLRPRRLLLSYCRIDTSSAGVTINSSRWQLGRITGADGAAQPITRECRLFSSPGSSVGSTGAVGIHIRDIVVSRWRSWR
jgi:hypothetical protein